MIDVKNKQEKKAGLDLKFCRIIRIFAHKSKTNDNDHLSQ